MTKPTKGKKVSEAILWKRFCKQVKEELNKITKPVCDRNNQSYNALEDVISNVMLFEMNIDEKPWDKIPKKKVRLPSKEELLSSILTANGIDEVLKQLLIKIKIKMSGSIDEGSPNYNHRLKAIVLYKAIEDYLEEA